MIDVTQHNTVITGESPAPVAIIKKNLPLITPKNTSQLNTKPNSSLPSGAFSFSSVIDYFISQDLIRIILKDTQKTDTQQQSGQTELIFPRKNLHSFHFSDHETILEYRKKDAPALKISVLPLANQVVGHVINTNPANNAPSFSFSYNLNKTGAILFSKFIETGWTLALSIEPQAITHITAVPKAATKPTSLATISSSSLEPKTKEPRAKDAPSQNPLPLQNSQTKQTSTKLNKKGTIKVSLFRPTKLLNKQLLPTSLHNLQKNTPMQKIFESFLHSKKKKILQKITPRIKAGTTLSLLFPDFKNYALMKKVSAYQEQPIEPNRVQAGYYIWQEDNKIITSSSTKLMPLRVAENILQKHMSLKPIHPRKNYLKQLNATYKIAMAQPFALNQKSLRRLRKLLRLARIELKENKSNNALSVADYGRLLTYLRSWVTYDYLKKFSVSKFQKYYRNVERIQGRGKYAHLKITQILGLQDTGRIIPNRNFLNHYHYAIDKAAQNHPRIPREWIEHIIWIETKGDPRAISHAGAYGLMQLLPDVFLGKGQKRAKSHKLAFANSINPFNAEQNIERGTAFLESLINYFGDVLKKYPLKTKKQIIFHAYNRGPTKVKNLVKTYGLGYTAHLPLETRLYLSRLGDFPL